MKIVVQIEADGRGLAHIHFELTYGLKIIARSATCPLDQASTTLKDLIDRLPFDAGSESL